MHEIFSPAIHLIKPNMTTATSIALPVLRLVAAGFDAVVAACRTAHGQGIAEVLIVSLIVRTRRSPHLADAAIRRLNAVYANVGFTGFPFGSMNSPQEMSNAWIMGLIVVACIAFATASQCGWARRQSVGVMPNSCLNEREKCAWLAKPQR
jgi:hypothetical protein